MKPLFSVVTLVRDESKSLPGLAESLRDFLALGGEWLCYDTGSADGGIALAESIGAYVVAAGEKHLVTVTEEQAEAINATVGGEEAVVKAGDRVFDFADARNNAAKIADSNWIVYIDADERVTLGIATINALLTPDRGLVRTWLTTENDSWLSTRIYNRKKLKFLGMCHEYLVGTAPHTEAVCPKEAFQWRHEQLHKEERPTRIKTLALQALLDPSYRNLFYYARELSYRGRPLTAAHYGEKASVKENPFAEEAAQGLVVAGDCMKAVGRDDEARSYWLRAYLRCPSRRIGLLRLAKDAFDSLNWAAVRVFAEAALKLPMGGYLEDPKEYDYLPHWLLYPAMWQLGDRESSREHFFRAQMLNPTDPKIKEDSRWYVDPLVTVIIPALGRAERTEKLREALRQQTYKNFEVIVEEDSFENRQGCPKTLAKGVARANGDLIAFLGQDTVPSPAYIEEAVAKMKQCFPMMDGAVFTNDGVHGDKHQTHWLAGRKLLPALGGEFFSTEFEHTWCDNEMIDRCKALGKYAYAERATLYHDNAIVQGGELDEVQKIAADPERNKRDHATYLRRKAERALDLPFTGERVVPDKMKGYEPTLEEHMARYRWAAKLVSGKVLDAPCGTGYGTAEMKGPTGPGGVPKNFSGCDISPEAVGYAKAKRWDIDYFIADLENPSIEGEYDTVVSFEGLEHLSDPRPFLKWAKAHAKRMIWSIPVDNPSRWHKVVYSVQEIKDLIEGEFGKDVEYYSQTGTEIKPLAEGENPVFVLGVSRW